MKKTTKLLSLLLSFLMITTMIAALPITADAATATSIKINYTSLTMTAGTSFTLKATISPSNATNKNVTWSSGNTTVAGMASGGVVKAKKAGTATITAKTTNGKKATCKITVKAAPAPTGVKLNASTLTMTAGTKYTLKATVSPSNAANKTVTWSSSNTTVAGMAAGGVINAKKAGTCTITAKTSNGKKATCKLTVKAAPAPSGIKLNASTLTMTEGTKYTIKATITPTNASNKNVTWSSSSPYVAGMGSGGVINAKCPGVCTITAKTSNGKTATCKITVKKCTSEFNEAFETEVVKLINAERTKRGLAALKKDSGAVKAAHVRAKELLRSFSHTRPDGRNFYSAADDLGVDFRAAGENIAYGYDTPALVVRTWMNSQGHKENILSTKFTKIGIGCCSDGETYYWLQFFLG